MLISGHNGYPDGRGDAWEPTAHLRWYNRVTEYRPKDGIGQTYRKEHTVLQQAWVCRTRPGEWRDVPTVSE